MTAASPPRRRNAAATRQALLDAAKELFGSQGFDQTTLREIGERAGVDASLIARYFGNKMAIYLASVTADAPELFDPAGPPMVDQLVRSAMARADIVGVSPMTRAMLQPEVDPEIREAAMTHLRARVLDPLMARLRDRGIATPELTAELVLAALMGIISVRASGSAPAIASTDRDTLTTGISALLNRWLETE